VANYSHNFQARLPQAQIDSGGDGTPDTTTNYEYNDRGIRICKTIDGTEALYLIDANNPTGYTQILEEKQDLNADGTIEHGEVVKSHTLGLDVISQAVGWVKRRDGERAGSGFGIVRATHIGHAAKVSAGPPPSAA